MPKIAQAYESNPRRPFIVCDFSPPRGASLDFLEDARSLDADFISVNYNPGRVPRADSAMTAHLIRQYTGHDVIFTLATRDMNPLALQSHLLGAAALGLENVLIVAGDPFPASNRPGTNAIGSLPPTQLIRIARNFNHGLDRRGRPLDGATNFCIGAAIDLSRNIEHAARLTRRKVEAGAQFFLTHPVFDPQPVKTFQSAYQAAVGDPLPTPVFYGLQILQPDPVAFSPIPPNYQRQLESGRSGEDIALEVWENLHHEGVDALYLIPPIGPRGARDYQAAARVIERIRS